MTSGAKGRLRFWSLRLRIDKDPTLSKQGQYPTWELGYGRVFAGKNTGAGQIVFLKAGYRF